MIFDSNMMMESANLDAVQESPYPLGIEGGLMHVYENECNFNAIMKAAGISELKYYKETGGDLFVQEAGAAGGLIDKFVSFFKKVKEKILQIFKKFVMFISSKISDDKKFATKYKKEVLKNFKKFKFNGYKFENLVPSINRAASNMDKAFPDTVTLTPDDFANMSSGKKRSDDWLEENENEFRGSILGESSLDEDEFKDKLKEQLYGDKEEFDVDMSKITEAFAYISEFKKNVSAVENMQKKINKNIDNIIKNFEKARDVVYKSIKDDDDNDTKTNKGDRMNELTQDVSLYRSCSNIVTTAFSTAIGAMKDCNRQSKAMCVKALNSGSRKSTEESAMYNDSDIFANVEII